MDTGIPGAIEEPSVPPESEIPWKSLSGKSEVRFCEPDDLLDLPQSGFDDFQLPSLGLQKRAGSKDDEPVRKVSKTYNPAVHGQLVSPHHFEKAVEEREKRKASKNRGSFNHSLTIAQRLDYLDAQQQTLKAHIMLDEEERMLNQIESRSNSKLDVTAEEDDMQELTIPADEHPVKKVNWRRDGFVAAALAVFCFGALTTIIAWDVREPRHDVHHMRMMKYVAPITSPLYAVSDTQDIVIPMDDDKPTEVIDIKMVVPCTGYCRDSSHRRLSGAVATSGSVRWELLADSRVLKSGDVALGTDSEAEAYETVVPDDLGAQPGEVLTVRLSTASPVALGVLCEVLQMGFLGRHRVVISGILFLIAFGLILSEQINRCYATFIGAMMALFMYCITYEAPVVATVMHMIDFGTLMLLCTMMMVVHILAVTGFFQWVAVRLAAVADGNAKVLFFVMANAMGWMSCILPNVTCVMLIGPITISLCKQMGLDPVPFYLAQTICSTIGGTTTMIGDPPNLVIGNKLSLAFMDFIVFNGPLVFVILPIASFLLFLRFRDKVSGTINIDIKKMKRENRIIDEKQFLYAATVFFFMAVGLFTNPLHGVRPCWICITGFFLMASVISHHHIKSYLLAVEWDTLLFFANLFIFVECLTELGLIRAIGTTLADVIRSVDIGIRLEVALVLVLWVSTLGSAFLESLPYTTTMTYILADLRNSDDLGIPVEPLCWALSVGACVGGIGSIMGSSANLVALAVSEKYSPERSIRGIDFLLYGFPTLLVITVIGTFYQLVLFAAIKPYT